MTDKRAFEAKLDAYDEALMDAVRKAACLGLPPGNGIIKARAAVLAAYDAATQSAPFKPTGDPALDAVLLKPDPAFDALVASLPANYWARYDLSAVRLGWHFGRAAAGREGQPVAWVPRPDLQHGLKLKTGFHARTTATRSYAPKDIVDLYTHPAPKAAADWVCVPREPTEEMCRALEMSEIGPRGTYKSVWSPGYAAMLSAAPARGGDDRDYGKVWHDHYYQAFLRWLEDDSTHWINDKDAAWQAWMYLHEEGLTTYPEAAMSREAQ